MANNIDEILQDIGSETPKINPYLGSKIYNKAKESESKKNIPFFKKPLIISLSSVLAVVVLLVIVFQPIIYKKFFNPTDDIPSGDHVITNPFVPNLSPNNQNTVFIEYNYTIYSDDFDIVTLVINNRINYQRIYLKAYNLSIEDVKLNNGDVVIRQVEIENQKFFEIVFENTNTKIHYIDLCFKKGAIETTLKKQKDFELQFILYIDEIDAEKGYGYNFSPTSIYDFRNGNNI